MKIRIALILLRISVAFNLAWMLLAPSLWMIPAALFGWYCADLMSGAIHMYMDYRPCRQGLGLDKLYFYTGSRESDDYIALRDATLGKVGPIERMVFDFKNHHPRPDALGRRSLRVLVGATVLYAALPFSILVNILCLLLPIPGWLIAMAAAFVIGGTFAQYFHGSLHRTDNPPAVLILRKLHLLMQPADHARHHATLQCDFSTITGWSNTLLNFVFDTLRRSGRMRDEGLEPD